MTEAKLNNMIAWGQYIHWSSIQYEQYRTIAEEDCQYSRFIGFISHWLASQYVIKGWEELKEHDSSIHELLAKYPDFIFILKRCRNAVYHYQNKILDIRIQKALREPELGYWAEVLQDEFARYLFQYPFKKYGIFLESVELHNAYFDCIGWKSSENILTNWYELFYLCLNYVKQNELNRLVKTS